MNSLMPSCSIIIPVWNGEGTIEECLDSVRNQTKKDFECIVVDDGSEDGTLQKAKQAVFGDRRFKFLSLKHQGLSASRNAGIDASQSDILLHIDSDDLAKPEMAEEASDFLMANDLDIVFFNADVVDCGISPIAFEAECRYFNRKKHYGIQKGSAFLKEMLLQRDWVYASFLQASRKSRIHRRFSIDMRAQDEVCTAENLLLADKVGHLDRILYTKRCFPSSTSRKRSRVFWAWCRMKAALELMRFADEENVKEPDILLPIIGRMLNQIQESIWKPKLEDEQWLSGLPFEERTMLYALARQSPYSSKYFSSLDKRNSQWQTINS